ncbi:MAG: hypothetical protein GXY83_10325 [Rhodopirellula sp.]|nr:hypothetical protein [Rhodopirellula sp.]
MSHLATCWRRVLASAILLPAVAAGEDQNKPKPFDVPIRNPSFTEGVDTSGLPLGWFRYGGGGKDQTITVVQSTGDVNALRIDDGDPEKEIGVVQTVPLKGGETYEATARVRAVEGDSSAGAYLQLRFLPSQEYVQTSLYARSTSTYSEVAVKGNAPPDTTKAVLYLYTHRDPTPALLVTDVKLVGGLPPPPPPPPPPVPPQYDTLKALHLEIPLVQSGKPAAAIIAPASGIYQRAAEAIQKAIENRTGARLPIIEDGTPQAAVPIDGNLIVLGNRSTNKTIGALYDLYYCLVDLKYPGPEGYVLRSIHNPFGNGHGVLVVGGSDGVGVEAGAEALVAVLAKGPSARGELSIGWTMETRLGRGVAPPTDIKQFETWEASKGYGSVGYFGWTSISKRMAMYYMTGDAKSAREVVRLSFPDQQTLKEIEEIDGERIENKHDPLAGFYHYNAHMAILFWDLIEESPIFSDEERLKITNAFARQLNHRKNEGIYGLRQPPACVGSRHGQWSAISLYCLGRYFNKDYPSPVWAQCIRGGELAFHPLHEHTWIAGESDNLFWYNTGIAPILTYMVLTGDRKPLENGVLGDLLHGQEILISGRVPDWALGSASIGFLNKAAYLTGDGRWVAYRQRTGVDTDVFRLGQSFWPDETILPQPPTDLIGKWGVQRLSEPAWSARGSGLPWEKSFYFASYRSAADAGGDFILLDGFNGASRNPYHTFDILELRLAGRTLLQGYHNQVLTSADGMVEPSVAMDAALLHCDVLGPTATAVGEVPAAAFCKWRRTLMQRTGRYALVVDDLTFDEDSQNMKVTTTWQTSGGAWNAKRQAIGFAATDTSLAVQIQPCDMQEARSGGGITQLNWYGSVKPGEHRVAIYLIGPAPPEASAAPACSRVADNAAALAVPQRALVVAGEFEEVKGELVVLAEDHLYGHAATEAVLVSAGEPLDFDWDFAGGLLHVTAAKPTQLKLMLASADDLRLDGEAAKGSFQQGAYTISLPAGRHELTQAIPSGEVLSKLAGYLERTQATGQKLREEATTATVPATPTAADLSVAMNAQIGGKAAAMIEMVSAAGPQLCVAAGRTIHVLSPDGEEIRQLKTDGDVRVLYWWAEPRLLLAGCVDEKVIAFDADGERRWVFSSQMDPAVYEAAKTYWFKTAPGHEGIHGLYAGSFDEGKNRCFVGSACTLEILDESGKLVKRMPIFWGPGRKFLLVDGPDQSRNLLVARWLNGTDTLAVVNSRTLTETGRGYYGVPAGHAYVGGWSAQNRTGLFYEDLDGDGSKEVATAINGTWNRVTVYSDEGQAIDNAQFGPGASSAERAQMRDMAVADLDGDGKKEIVVGISEGLVVVLNSHCRKVWATRLSSPPFSVRCLAPRGGRLPWVVAGCEDGTVAALDGKGRIVGLGKVNGRPLFLEGIESETGPLAVFATDKGEVKAFELVEQKTVK